MATPPACTGSTWAPTRPPDVQLVEAALGRAVAWNNANVRAHATDRFDANPRAVDDLAWNRSLEAAWPEIRAEWDAFAEAGGRLPRIEDLIDEHQGNEGAWRAGLLVSKGRSIGVLDDRFPATVRALAGVPGLWSALWSVLDAGAELPEHEGPNAGVLRYHLGVRCGDDAALSVGDHVEPYRDGHGILFDDTAPHAAWNHGPQARITLFLEVIRPTVGPTRWGNSTAQRLLALDDRYRGAPQRAAEWDRALNR